MLKIIWMTFLALFRLSEKAVCEMSEGIDSADFHDHRDSTNPMPHMMLYEHTCKRCGKKFII